MHTDMGCDIHIFVEELTDKGVECFSAGPIEFERDNYFFGVFSGLRSDQKPKYEPRDLPVPLSSEVFEEYLFPFKK